MENKNPLSPLLAKHLTGISFEDEPEDFILTDNEANAAIEHALTEVQKHYAWKYYDKGLNTQEEILLKLSTVDWYEHIDVVDILERANSNKLYQVWQKEKREKDYQIEKDRQDHIKQTWNANQFYKLIKYNSRNLFDRPLIHNENTMSVIRPLCYFLSEDPRFETELGYSLGKGVIFRGTVGVGKTFTVRCAAENERCPIFIISMIEIAQRVKEQGEYVLPEGYGKYYLDDVGSEETTVNYYGTKITWFKEFLEIFYLRSNIYNKLIISTNCSSADLQELYGFRVRSRLREMFNLIDVTGEDLRR